MAGLSARSPAPRPAPRPLAPARGPLLHPGGGSTAHQDGRRWPWPYTASPPPARLPFTFSAPDRPCRSISDAAMAVTRGSAGRGPDGPEVAPGLTPPLRALRRRGPAPGPRAPITGRYGGGAERGRGRGPRAHPSRLPAPSSAPQATPPGGADSRRRGGSRPSSPGAGCARGRRSGLAVSLSPEGRRDVCQCLFPRCTDSRPCPGDSGPDPESSVWWPRGTLGPGLSARPASLGCHWAASGRTPSCDAHGQQWSPLFIAHPAGHLGRDRGHALSP